jgi:Ca-activated chloride channel family protein
METTSLTFQSPAWFAALALVPVFCGLLIWAQIRSERLISRVVAPRLREQLAGAVSKGLRIFRAVLVLAAFSAIVVALARPQYGFIEQEILQQGRDIIIAVDTSRSMLATDVTPNRLTRAKLFAKDLLRLAEGDRVGVIAFAGGAFLQAPLTLDRSASLAAIDELDTTIIPKGGTNIGEAIRMATKAFGKGEGQTRALVILTDGEELDADGIAAARQAYQEGVRIFTVGVGSAEGSLIPVRDDSGRQDFVRDQAGKPVQTRLDASRLAEIATAGGGFYEALEADTAAVIFERGILPMETTERGSMASRQPREKYQWPLGVGIGLLAIWLLVGERRRNGHRAAIAAAAVMLSCVPSQARSGTAAYEAGSYEEALGDFQSRLGKSPESPKLQFNAGAAAYKLNKHAEAVDFFAKALASGSPEPDFLNSATYNLANALVRRGESAEKNEDKKADWKNAISHYETVLKSDPKNKMAEENRDIVKKLLEDLEKQEEEQKKDQQDQKKDDQKKDQKQDQKDNQKQDQKDDQQKDDQQNQDQKNQDQQNKDEQKQDQQNKDQQGQDNQDKQDQQNEGQKQDPGKDEEKKDGDEKDKKPGDQDQQEPGKQSQPHEGNEGQDSKQQPGAAPTPTPGEKKEGEIKSLGGEEQAAEELAAAEEAAEKDGQMSEAQARALLNSLRRDEDRVPLMRPAMQEETLKDW